MDPEERCESMKAVRIFLCTSAVAVAGAIFTFAPAAAQSSICPPAQQCPNGPRVPFPVISPVQGLNTLAQRLGQRRDQPQQPLAPVPWNYAPIATPPQNLPPELQR
jgi:hypothetical protein